jgi:hypothetical protein
MGFDAVESSSRKRISQSALFGYIVEEEIFGSGYCFYPLFFRKEADVVYGSNGITTTCSTKLNSLTAASINISPPSS